MGRGAQPSLSWCPDPAAVARGPGNCSRPLRTSAVALKVPIYKRDLAQKCFVQQKMQEQATSFFFFNQIVLAVLVGFCRYCQVCVLMH